MCVCVTLVCEHVVLPPLSLSLCVCVCVCVCVCSQGLPPLPDKEVTKLDRMRRQTRVKELVYTHSHWDWW